MPNPTITPYATPTTAYQVSDSDTAYYDISLSNLGDSAEFLIQVPNGAEVTIWALGVAGNPWAPAPADTRTLFNGSTWTGAMLAGWNLGVSPGSPAVISVNQGAGPSSGSIRIRVTNIRNAAPTATCTLTAQINADTVRILADPSISGTPAATGVTLFEGTDFTLTATVSVTEEHGVVPVVFGALPAVTGVWEVDPNNLAIEELTGLNPVFHAPGVYEDTDVGFTLQVFYDFDGSGAFSAGEPDNDAHVLLTIQRAHHRMILVLDRSGSMSAKLQPTDDITRWDAALRASHIWADVFLAMRGGEGQQIGILTFEHGGCSWGQAAGSSEIRLRNPSNGGNASNLESTGAYTNRTNLNLGSPQSCTPLGDAVVKAAQALVGTATGINTTSPQASDYLSLVVLTDGYENSGLVTVRNAPPSGQPSVSTLASRLNQPEFDALDSNRFKLYTIGVGSSVDEDALDSLPSTTDPSSSGNGYYRLTLDLADFSDVLGQMLGDTIDAQQVVVNPAGNEATFDLNAGERRLVVVVPWDVLGDTIELSHRTQGSGEAWTPIAPGAGSGATLFQRVHHGMMVVDLEQAFDGSVPARQWRVRHLSGGAAQPLTNVLVYVDLHVKAFLSVDKTSYRTGEPIQLRCELRAGSKPIKNATIRVEVLAPGEGLGTFLATHGAALGPIPVTQLATLAHPGASQAALFQSSAVHNFTTAINHRRGDPLAPKGALFHSFLAQDKLSALPLVVPPPPFVDGTNRLHDDGAHGDGRAGDGTYANSFARTFKEGTYTFRVVVEGRLEDGSRFTRKVSLSKWVGVRPSPAHSPIATLALPSPGDGRLALWVAVQPRDERGEYLGPFRESDLVFTTTAGTFEGDTVSTVDGTYYRKLVYPAGDMPVIQVWAAGVPLRPTLTFEPDFCLGIDELCRHFQAGKHHLEGLVQCGAHIKGIFACSAGIKGSVGRLCSALRKKCSPSRAFPAPVARKAPASATSSPCAPCHESKDRDANSFHPEPPRVS